MGRIVVTSLGILLCASAAIAQPGGINLFSDPTYTDCHFYDAGPGLQHVYVVHVFTPGVTASQWMLVNNGMLCTYLAESSPFITIGDAFSGISVAYGACLAYEILLLDISYFCNGLSPACATITVEPDPAAPTGTIEVVDCAANKLVGMGGVLWVNPDGTCSCIIPTESTSWGRVKALYR